MLHTLHVTSFYLIHNFTTITCNARLHHYMQEQSHRSVISCLHACTRGDHSPVMASTACRKCTYIMLNMRNQAIDGRTKREREGRREGKGRHQDNQTELLSCACPPEPPHVPPLFGPLTSISPTRFLDTLACILAPNLRPSHTHMHVHSTDLVVQ